MLELLYHKSVRFIMTAIDGSIFWKYSRLKIDRKTLEDITFTQVLHW